MLCVRNLEEEREHVMAIGLIKASCSAQAKHVSNTYHTKISMKLWSCLV